MNDDEYLQTLVREYGKRKRKSPIRRIANAIYIFLDEYHIDLNPMERERLSLYLVHYRNPKKAAAHIYPIHPGLKKIPECKKRLARIIKKVSDEYIDNDLKQESQSLDEELNKTVDEKPNYQFEKNIEFKNRKNKIAKIKSFNDETES